MKKQCKSCGAWGDIYNPFTRKTEKLCKLGYNPDADLWRCEKPKSKRDYKSILDDRKRSDDEMIQGDNLRGG